MNNFERFLKLTENLGKNIKIVGMPKTFWVLTSPTAKSELADILFETDYMGLMLQAKGGLDISSIIGIYKNKNDAMKRAQELF